MGNRDINLVINYSSVSLLQTKISAMKKSDKEPWKYITVEPDIVWKFKEGFLHSKLEFRNEAIGEVY